MSAAPVRIADFAALIFSACLVGVERGFDSCDGDMERDDEHGTVDGRGDAGDGEVLAMPHDASRERGQHRCSAQDDRYGATMPRQVEGGTIVVDAGETMPKRECSSALASLRGGARDLMKAADSAQQHGERR